MLLIGAETLSRITDWNDRGTAILFADGAAAVVVEAVDGPGQLLGWDLDADGAAQPYLYADVGDYLKMDGREVFRRAVRLMVDSAVQGARGQAGVAPDDIALIVPHQANIRIIDAACQRLGIPIERTATEHRPLRQHLGGLHPAGPGRGPRGGPRRRRRPRAARRLRRRHDRGQRRPPLEQPVIVP